jgi:hypothetical protein
MTRLHNHHVGAHVNAPTTTVPVTPELHQALQQSLKDAGVNHDHIHQPSPDERIWAMCTGMADICNTLLSHEEGVPGLPRAVELVTVGLGRELAQCNRAEDTPTSLALGPDPMRREGRKARSQRSKRKRRPRLCWGCGTRLGPKQRKWCVGCVDDPEKRRTGHDHADDRAGREPMRTGVAAPADGIGVLLGMGTGLSRDMAGAVQSGVRSWLVGIGRMADPIEHAWELADDYQRDAELADAAAGVVPVLETYAKELINRTQIRNPTVADVLRHIDAVLHAVDLMGTAISALRRTAACQTAVQAHAVLDDFADQLRSFQCPT